MLCPAGVFGLFPKAGVIRTAAKIDREPLEIRLVPLVTASVAGGAAPSPPVRQEILANAQDRAPETSESARGWPYQPESASEDSVGTPLAGPSGWYGPPSAQRQNPLANRAACFRAVRGMALDVNNGPRYAPRNDPQLSASMTSGVSVSVGKTVRPMRSRSSTIIRSEHVVS